MVTVEAITRSLQEFWSTGFSSATTVYPGQQVNTSALTDWVELWIETWDEAIRRDAAPHAVRVVMTVHCFSRSATAATRGPRIADAARDALARKTIDIRDFEMSGEPLLGHVRLREAEIRDMTRQTADDHRGVLQHFLVVISGQVDSLIEVI